MTENKPESAAFLVNRADNVVTLLTEVNANDEVKILGDVGKASASRIKVLEKIAAGHKSALRDIKEGEDIIKYGVVIGRATRAVKKGEWVHLHCMKSVYDERSSHLDVITGAPKDIKYE